jgi:hypothetical protein
LVQGLLSLLLTFGYGLFGPSHSGRDRCNSSQRSQQ